MVALFFKFTKKIIKLYTMVVLYKLYLKPIENSNS